MATPEDDGIIDSLLSFMPGYTAYKDASRWLEDDRETRAFIAKRIDDCTGQLDSILRSAANAVKLALVAEAESCRKSLQLSKSRVQSSVEGKATWLSTGRTSESTIAAIREHDLGLVSIVDRIDATLQQTAKDLDHWKSDGAQTLVAELDAKLDRRDELLKHPID